MSKQARSWVGVELSDGRYVVISQLGEGAMGSVYRATDRNLDSEVVVKIPLDAMLQDPDFAPRFDREIRALVKLSHPHIVKVSDFGNHQGTPFAIMQFLRGGDMDNRRPRRADGFPGPMASGTLASWLPDIANALDFMHAKGFIHRDIKPTNILFDENNHAFLADFGVVGGLANTPAASTRAMTAAGLVIGTPEYMAPEIIMGEPFDGRADQYSLAIMIYELLAGRRPFEGNNATALIVQQSTKAAPPLRSLAPHVSEGLAQAIHRALAKSPAERFANCAALAREVMSHLGGAGSSVTVPKLSNASADQGQEFRSVVCPVCASGLKVNASFVGRRLRCPTCRTSLKVTDDLQLQLGQDSSSSETLKINLGDRMPAPPLNSPGTSRQGTQKLDLGTGKINQPIRPSSTRILLESVPEATVKPAWKKPASIAAAAAIFLVIGLATFFLIPRKAAETPLVPKPASNDLADSKPLAKMPARELVVAKPKAKEGSTRRKRPKLQDDVLINERFDTDDIQVGELPSGWEGSLTIVEDPESGRMSLSLGDGSTAGQVEVVSKEITGHFLYQVDFVLPDASTADSTVEIHLETPPDNSPEWFIEVQSSGSISILEGISKEKRSFAISQLKTNEMSTFVLERTDGRYQLKINGIRVEYPFADYLGRFVKAGLRLTTSDVKKRPRIQFVKIKATGEQANEVAAASRMKNREVESPAAPEPVVRGFRELFEQLPVGGGLPVGWVLGENNASKYHVSNHNGRMALALTKPALVVSPKFVEHPIKEPIDGDFSLKFEVSIPNEDSRIFLRFQADDGALIEIDVSGSKKLRTLLVKNGKPHIVSIAKDWRKLNAPNQIELRRIGNKFSLFVNNKPHGMETTSIGKHSFRSVAVKIETGAGIPMSPLLYSLDIQPIDD